MLKLMSLNIWNGRLENDLLGFVSKYSKDVDIFCFQESLNVNIKPTSYDPGHSRVPNIHGKLQSILDGFTGYFEAAQDDDKGLSTFIRNKMLVDKVGNEFVYRSKNSMINGDRRTIARNVLYLTLTCNRRRYSVMNFHGLWDGFSNDDNDDRINQSAKLLNLVNKLDGEIILCGDFNLHHDTRSIRMIEDRLRNLMNEYGVQNTRTSLTDKQECIDYIFVSSGIHISSFQILEDIVSDHCAILIEVS